MASSKARQRKLARAKMERQLARRAQRDRRRRQTQAGVAIGLVVAIGIVVGLWVGGVFSSQPATTPLATCVWNTPANTQSLTDVGKPPTSGEPRSGTETMTITTDQGTITVALDLDKAPCAAASFSYLASKNFFDNTKCHRLTTSGSYVLQCGDPMGDGTGGPAYTFADENLPSPKATPGASGSSSPGASASASTTASGSASPGASPSTSPGAAAYYPRGTVAMANKGPDTNGSQFFIVYKDSNFDGPKYSIIGKVTGGMDVVDRVAAAGAVNADGKATSDGKPKIPVTIQTLTVSTPGSSPSPSPSGSVPPTTPSSSVTPSEAGKA